MKKRAVLLMALILCLLLCINETYAETGTAEFSASVSSEEVVVGEKVYVKLSVKSNLPSGEALNTWK